MFRASNISSYMYVYMCVRGEGRCMEIALSPLFKRERETLYIFFSFLPIYPKINSRDKLVTQNRREARKKKGGSRYPRKKIIWQTSSSEIKISFGRTRRADAGIATVVAVRGETRDERASDFTAANLRAREIRRK